MPDAYLSKYAIFDVLIHSEPVHDLGMIVVIPSYLEEDVVTTLNSLWEAKPPPCAAEVIVIINHSSDASPANKETSHKCLQDVQLFSQQNNRSNLTCHPILLELAPKKAGVGMARKAGMDEAVRRFGQVGKNGLIVNLDADCVVSLQYWRQIHRVFTSDTAMWAGGLHFEHDVSLGSQTNESAIIDYELHLRYFIEAQRKIQLPYAFHTIGSAMACTVEGYRKVGGMNSRKAGEDFYFLHKFISIGRFKEIPKATVFPSARISNRVPFGTGRAVGDILSGSPQLTYQFQSFVDLYPVIDRLQQLFELANPVVWLKDMSPLFQDYITSIRAIPSIQEILDHAASYPTFRNRFFQWFNAFRLMKYLHFARNVYPDIPVFDQALSFAKTVLHLEDGCTNFELLEAYRQHQRHIWHLY